jgi:hypothetical protein
VKSDQLSFLHVSRSFVDRQWTDHQLSKSCSVRQSGENALFNLTLFLSKGVVSWSAARKLRVDETGLDPEGSGTQDPPAAPLPTKCIVEKLSENSKSITESSDEASRCNLAEPRASIVRWLAVVGWILTRRRAFSKPTLIIPHGSGNVTTMN